MEENAATESPMWNGDGVTSADDQTPIEEESMSTTVLKGDGGRINWPGSEGDSEGDPSPATAATESGKTASSGDQSSVEMEEKKDTEEAISSADYSSDPDADDIPPPAEDNIPPPTEDDIPPPADDDIPSPAEDDIPAPALQVDDLPDPVIDDEVEPELQALADNHKEDSEEGGIDQDTLGVVQIIVTPGTPVPESCESPPDLTQERPPSEEDDSSYTEEQSPQTPASTEDVKQETVADEVITPEENLQLESSPEDLKDSTTQDQSLEEDATEEQNPEAEQAAEQPDTEEPTKDEPSVDKSVAEDVKEPDVEEEKPEEPVATSLEEEKSPDGPSPIPLESTPEDEVDPRHEDDDLVKFASEIEMAGNEEDTDSPTISEGGSTPKHDLPDDSVDVPPQEESIPQEVETEEGEIEPQKVETEHATISAEEPGDTEEHIPYPEDTQSEALNGKEPVSAEAFFDEAFASESPDITDEPEVVEDQPPPVEEETIAQSVKSDSSPSTEIAWPSENTPEIPTETQPTVTEPEKISSPSEKMGVKGEHTVDIQHKNKDDRMTGSDKAKNMPFSTRLALFEKTENDSSQRSLGRAGSKRLDTNRFSHFNKSTEELDIIEKPKSPTKKTANSNRLDRSRFAKFEMNNQTNGEAQPKKVTRNFVINKAAKKRFGSDSSDSGQPSSNECCVCNKRVYPMEKITADSKPYHKTCFRCTECRKCLSLGNYAALNGCLYCKPHFTQLFKLKGNYNDGFAPGASKTFQSKAQTEEGEDSPDTSPTKDANVTSPGASSDNTDVIRSADELEETRVMTSPGGLRSVKDQFEGGNVSSVKVKKMMDDEVIRPTTMQSEESAPEGVNTSGISENEPIVRDDVVRAGTPSDDPMSVSGGTRSILSRFEKGEVVQEADSDEDQSPSKKVDVSAEIEEAKRREEEIQRSGPAVSENEPVIRDDVIRAGDAQEDFKLTSGGLGSLKDRFEKGAVSNIDDTPRKDPIKIGNLEDLGAENAESSQGTVSENTPLVRDDVVHSSDKQDDPGIKTGASRSLKAMFEKGGVSNVEDKPKDKIEMSPRSLEDSYSSTDGAVSGISENTPIERDDVVKSSVAPEEPGIKTGGLRNLRSLFEKGNVTNVEEKPRQVIKQNPSSLDSMAPSDGGVSENTPEVRDDLVRETTRDDAVEVSAGHSRSLKNKWEKGEVERPEANYKTIISKEEPQVAESKPEAQREDVVTGDMSTGQVEIEEGSSKSLRDRFEKDADDEQQEQEQEQEQPEIESQQNEAHENGMHQNGGEQQNGEEQIEEQNGIIEDGMSPQDEQEESPQQEIASWEIKAARASALADSPIDGEETLDM